MRGSRAGRRRRQGEGSMSGRHARDGPALTIGPPASRLNLPSGSAGPACQSHSRQAGGPTEPGTLQGRRFVRSAPGGRHLRRDTEPFTIISPWYRAWSGPSSCQYSRRNRLHSAPERLDMAEIREKRSGSAALAQGIAGSFLSRASGARSLVQAAFSDEPRTTQAACQV